ncbi:MAG: DUF3108 domain-containing protein [Saprospiraceae bacterium]
MRSRMRVINVYHIEVTGKTYTSYEWFYKVSDKFHTYLDKKTLMPRLFIRDIPEGSYQHYEKLSLITLLKKSSRLLEKVSAL